MATNQLLSLPANSTGLSPASAASAWGYGSWVAITASMPVDGYLTGLVFQNQAVPSLDSTQEFIFDIGVGAAGTEVIKLQVPYSFRQDSSLGYYLMNAPHIFFPEPYFVPSGSRISVRVADNRTTVLTYNNTKLSYRQASLPTVALNTPDDASSGSDTTPTLNFTGTNGEGDTLEYEVQIDTANTFNSGSGYVADESIIDSSSNSLINNCWRMGPGLSSTGIGHSFQAARCKLTKAVFYLNKYLSPTGNIYAKIYAHSGTYGTSSIKTGDTLAVSDAVDISTIPYLATAYTLPGTYTKVAFNFSGANQIDLSGNTYYVISVEYPTGTNGAGVDVGESYLTNAHAGNDCQIFSDGSATASVVDDSSFIVMGQLSGALIDKFSVLDTGFTAGHPYSTATAVDYTVQSALSGNTYYWRVRALDVAGSNILGGWSTPRSFTIGVIGNIGVALNTPTDGASDTDTTPTLNFMGTDSDGHTLEFELQVDPANTFDSGTQTGVVVASFPQSNYNAMNFMSGASGFRSKIGQAFKPGSDCVLTSAKFYLNGGYDPTGNAYVRIYAGTGTFGTDMTPTGSALASSEALDTSAISRSIFELITFNFTGANQINLTAGTAYVIVLEYTYDVTTYLLIGYNDGATSYEGNICAYTTYWGTGAWDACFYVYGTTAGGPLIDKLSVSDTGFTAGHPFASGTAIDYTVQSALTQDTYYWRVRAIDPLGGNIRSDWSATRSFTVVADWVAKSLKVYIGGVWVAKPLKAYVGGSWVAKSLKKC